MSFCLSAYAPEATEKYVFLSSSPANVKFEVQDSDSQLHELDFDDLLKKATEVACEKQRNRRNESQLSHFFVPAWRAGVSHKRKLLRQK